MIISDFDQFTKDQELRISKGEVDYLEGFGSFPSNSSNISSHTIMDEQGEPKVPDPYHTIRACIIL